MTTNLEIIGSLNNWVLSGTTQEEMQKRTDMTWRLMEYLEHETEREDTQ